MIARLKKASTLLSTVGEEIRKLIIALPGIWYIFICCQGSMVIALPVWPMKITVSSTENKKKLNNIIKQQQSTLNASNMLSKEIRLMKLESDYSAADFLGVHITI